MPGWLSCWQVLGVFRCAPALLLCFTPPRSASAKTIAYGRISSETQACWSPFLIDERKTTRPALLSRVVFPPQWPGKGLGPN